MPSHAGSCVSFAFLDQDLIFPEDEATLSSLSGGRWPWKFTPQSRPPRPHSGRDSRRCSVGIGELTCRPIHRQNIALGGRGRGSSLTSFFSPARGVPRPHFSACIGWMRGYDRTLLACLLLTLKKDQMMHVAIVGLFSHYPRLTSIPVERGLDPSWIRRQMHMNLELVFRKLRYWDKRKHVNYQPP